MFNPELKGIYSADVENELEKLAEDFESKGIQCWVYGLKNMYGIKAPEAVYYDNKDDSVRIQLFRMCQRYTDSLSPEEDENFGRLHALGDRSDWIAEEVMKSKALWI